MLVFEPEPDVLFKAKQMRLDVLEKLKARNLNYQQNVTQAQNRIHSIEKDYTPFILELERVSEHQTHQIAELEPLFKQLQENLIPKLRKTSEAVESTISTITPNNAQSALDPLRRTVSNLRQQVSSLEEDITDDRNEANERFDNVRIQFQKGLGSFENDNAINLDRLAKYSDHLNTLDNKFIAYQRSAQSFLQKYHDYFDLRKKAVSYLRNVRDLEGQGVDLISEQISKIGVDHITDITLAVQGELDDFDTVVSDTRHKVENALNTKIQTDLIHNQIEDMGTQFEDVINKNNSSIDDCKTRIAGQCNQAISDIQSVIDSHKSEFQWELDQAHKDIDWINTQAGNAISQSQNEWNEFIQNDTICTEKVRQLISEIREMINGKMSLMNRLQQAQLNVDMIKDRLKQWTQAKRYLSTVEEWESKLSVLEDRLHHLDGKSVNTRVLRPFSRPPKAATNERQVYRVPADLRLTYDDDEPIYTFPVIPERNPKPSFMPTNRQQEVLVSYPSHQDDLPLLPQESQKKRRDSRKEVSDFDDFLMPQKLSNRRKREDFDFTERIEPQPQKSSNRRKRDEEPRKSYFDNETAPSKPSDEPRKKYLDDFDDEIAPKFDEPKRRYFDDEPINKAKHEDSISPYEEEPKRRYFDEQNSPQEARFDNEPKRRYFDDEPISPSKQKAYDDEPKKRYFDDEQNYPKKTRFDDEPKKRYFDDEPISPSKQNAYDDEPKKRYFDDEPKSRHDDQNRPKRYSPDDRYESPKRRYNDEVSSRYEDDQPRRKYDDEPKRRYYDGQKSPKRDEPRGKRYEEEEPPRKTYSGRYQEEEMPPRRKYDDDYDRPQRRLPEEEYVPPRARARDEDRFSGRERYDDYQPRSRQQPETRPRQRDYDDYPQGRRYYEN